MRKFIAPFLATMAVLAACSKDVDTTTAAEPASMSMPDAGGATSGTLASANGTVQSIDQAAGKIVIAHGPVEALQWPAMTMGFTASPEQMASVRPGQQVAFEFTSRGQANTLTRITPDQ